MCEGYPIAGNAYTDSIAKNIGYGLLNNTIGVWNSTKGIWVPFDNQNVQTLDMAFNRLSGQPSTNLINAQIAGKTVGGLFYDNCEGGKQTVTSTASLASLGPANYCASKGMRLPSLSEITTQTACSNSHTVSQNSAGNQSYCGYSVWAWYISNGGSTSWATDRDSSCGFTSWVYVRCVR